MMSKKYENHRARIGKGVVIRPGIDLTKINVQSRGGSKTHDFIDQVLSNIRVYLDQGFEIKRDDDGNIIATNEYNKVVMLYDYKNKMSVHEVINEAEDLAPRSVLKPNNHYSPVMKEKAEIGDMIGSDGSVYKGEDLAEDLTPIIGNPERPKTSVLATLAAVMELDSKDLSDRAALNAIEDLSSRSALMDAFKKEPKKEDLESITKKTKPMKPVRIKVHDMDGYIKKTLEDLASRSEQDLIKTFEDLPFQVLSRSEQDLIQDLSRSEQDLTIEDLEQDLKKFEDLSQYLYKKWKGIKFGSMIFSHFGFDGLNLIDLNTKYTYVFDSDELYKIKGEIMK